jgi:hypothetical protein
MSAVNAVIDATAVSFGIVWTVVLLVSVVYLALREGDEELRP